MTAKPVHGTAVRRPNNSSKQGEQQPGFEERIEGFKRLRKLAVITSSPFNVLNDALCFPGQM